MKQRAVVAAGKQMQRLTRLSTVLLVLAWYVGPAHALPLTLFRHQSQAELHCPGDRVVWLDLAKSRYYLQGQRRYGQGHSGSFACLNEARRSGYRRSIVGLR